MYIKLPPHKRPNLSRTRAGASASSHKAMHPTQWGLTMKKFEKHCQTALKWHEVNYPLKLSSAKVDWTTQYFQIFWVLMDRIAETQLLN